MIEQIKKQISEIESMLETAVVGTPLFEALSESCNALYDVESELERPAFVKKSNPHHNAWID